MHELNNPLEAAWNLAHLIRQDAEDAQKVRAYIGLLEEQLAQVTHIAGQTLSYYKAPNSTKRVDLVDVANAALRVHERKISAKKLRLRTVLPDSATVKGCAGEILQVLTNLMGNALDALQPGGILCVKVRKCEDEVHIIVADNGHGIPDATLARVFEPFFTTKQENGTGLGLAISKSIVESHEGRIRARSCVRPGRSGTAFRVSLPTKALEAANQAAM